MRRIDNRDGAPDSRRRGALVSSEEILPHHGGNVVRASPIPPGQVSVCPWCGDEIAAQQRMCTSCRTRHQVEEALRQPGVRGRWHPNWPEIVALLLTGLVAVALVFWLVLAFHEVSDRQCLKRDVDGICLLRATRSSGE